MDILGAINPKVPGKCLDNSKYVLFAFLHIRSSPEHKTAMSHIGLAINAVLTLLLPLQSMRWARFHRGSHVICDANALKNLLPKSWQSKHLSITQVSQVNNFGITFSLWVCSRRPYMGSHLWGPVGVMERWPACPVLSFQTRTYDSKSFLQAFDLAWQNICNKPHRTANGWFSNGKNFIFTNFSQLYRLHLVPDVCGQGFLPLFEWHPKAGCFHH